MKDKQEQIIDRAEKQIQKNYPTFPIGGLEWVEKEISELISQSRQEAVEDIKDMKKKDAYMKTSDGRHFLKSKPEQFSDSGYNQAIDESNLITLIKERKL